MDPNLRTLASMWIDPAGKRVKVEIGSDVGTSLDFLDVRISGLWVDTPESASKYHNLKSDSGANFTKVTFSWVPRRNK